MNKNIQKNKLFEQIRKSFPNIRWQSVKYISSGFDNDVIILDNKLVFRFPKNNYSRKIFKDEVGLLGFLVNKLSIRLPEYKYIAKNYSFGGYPLIRGEELTKNKLKIMSVKQKHNLAKKLALFLSELHSIPLNKIKKFNPRERDAAKELKQLRQNAGKYVFPILSKADRIFFEDFFVQLSEVLKQKYKKVLVHGDFSGDHFIINRQSSLAGIIDFTDKAIHDSAFDFIFLWEFGREFVQLIFDNYDNISKEGVVERARVYAQASALWNMLQAKKTGILDYNEWYRRFKGIK